MWDWIMNFFGNHGVKVKLTKLERQDPGTATFPLHDSVLKGRFEVQGSKAVDILNHSMTLFIRHKGAGEEGADVKVTVGEDINEGEIMGSDISWPYTLEAGKVYSDSFCMINVDIPAGLAELGFDDPEDGLNDPKVSFFLKVEADVKGTLVDAETTIKVNVIPGGVEAEAEEPTDEATEEVREAGVRTTPAPANDESYVARFKAMVAELEAREDITVETAEFHPPATEEQFAAAAAIQATLPPAMKRFYTECNGMEILWSKNGPGDSQPNGRIKILPIQDVFTSWAGHIWFDEEWDDGKFKPLHPIDFFVDEACAAVYVDGSDDPPIYYHYCGEEMESLELNFAQYMELLLLSRGYWYWMKSIVVDLTGNDYTIEAGNFRRGVRKLFPDHDEAFFFRNSYAAADDAKTAERQAKADVINSALTDAGVTYTFSDDGGGYFNITLKDNDDANEAKAATAMATMDLDFEFDDKEWGAKSIGSVFMSRS